MQLKYKFEIMELDGNIIAVPVGENVDDFRGVVRLNETAAMIFELLTRGASEDQIVDSLYEKYNSSRDEIASDVQRYLEAFQEKGLLLE